MQVRMKNVVDLFLKDIFKRLHTHKPNPLFKYSRFTYIYINANTHSSVYSS